MNQVLGHDLIKSRLLTMIQMDRVPSCLIYSGPGGIGKRALAWAMAQDLLCDLPENGQACGQCGPCVRVASQQSESVLFIEPKGLQIKIDQARQVLRFLNLKSVSEKRVVIINEAHLLNPQSSNALLKSIEEPPDGVYFVLVVQTLSALLPTIISRSQVIRFQPLRGEHVKAITGAEDWVVKASQGRVEHALQLMEQGNSKELRELALKFWKMFTRGEADDYIFNQIDQIVDREMALNTAFFWKQIIRDAIIGPVDFSKCIHADQEELIQSLSHLGHDRLQKMYFLTDQMESDIKSNVDRKLCFENFHVQIQEVL